jgi:hypothetical protein
LSADTSSQRTRRTSPSWECPLSAGTCACGSARDMKPSRRPSSRVGALEPLRGDVAGGGGTPDSSTASSTTRPTTGGGALEAVEISTRAGAFALRREGEIGSLEPGNGAARALRSETYWPHPFEAGSELLRTRRNSRDTSPQPRQLSLNYAHVRSIDLLIHQTTDPEVVVAEFTYRWHSRSR